MWSPSLLILVALIVFGAWAVSGSASRRSAMPAARSTPRSSSGVGSHWRGRDEDPGFVPRRHHGPPGSGVDRLRGRRERRIAPALWRRSREVVVWGLSRRSVWLVAGDGGWEHSRQPPRVAT